jgi:hypothetical protein
VRAVNQAEPQPPRTVSEILAAHAAAQIAAAQDADHAGHSDVPVKARAVQPHCASFTVSWAAVSMCIGFKKPVAGQGGAA